MLVQQTIKFLHQQKQARILLKLDITKAFDLVSWPFLLELLQRLGFGQIWCDIISGLLASSSTQILLNGSPGDKIEHCRGLRQGDPLSPMLFILVMDVLCLLIKKASEELLQPLARSALQHRVSLYADDVVIFLRPSASDISITLEILQFLGKPRDFEPTSKRSLSIPYSAWKKIEQSCFRTSPVRSLIFLASTWEFLSHLTSLPELKFNPSLTKLLTGCKGGKLTYSLKLVGKCWFNLFSHQC